MRKNIINKKNIISMLWIILYIVILPFVISCFMDIFYSIICYKSTINFYKNGPSGFFKIKQLNATDHIYIVLYLKTIICLTTLSSILFLLSIIYNKRILIILINIFMSFVVINTTNFYINFTNMILLCKCSFIFLSTLSLVILVATKKYHK
mgnify:CR=1 FL=1